MQQKTIKTSDIIAIFNKDKKTLFSISDILAEFELEDNALNNKRMLNTLRKLRIDKVIYRHVDKDSLGDFQYAVDIKTENIAIWVKKSYTTNTSPKKKSKILSKKEIQSMFAAQYNDLATLEDSVMRTVEDYETLSKEMARIKNFIGK